MSPTTDEESPDTVRRAELTVFGLAVGAMALVAWTNRFIQDDAFISFRYARHLAAGHGLVWNVGEPPIAGFSNPLWTLLIALGIRGGLEPVRMSQAMGVACFVGTLVAAGSLAARLTGSRRVGTATVLAMGLNESFNAFATGGLETQSQVMFVTLVAFFTADELSYPRARPRSLALASMAAGLALWTRLDSGLLVVPLMGPALLAAWRSRSRLRLAAGVLPGAVLGAGVLAFHWFAFRAVLPNTFYAKTGDRDVLVMVDGADYVLSFLMHYQVLPILAIALYLGRGALAARPAFAGALLCACALWIVYVVVVGGDFMEYRLMVPLVPLGGTALAWMLHRAGDRVVGIASIASIAASAYFYLDVKNKPALAEGDIVETVHGLDAHLTDDDQDWAAVGRGLRRALACDRQATIAVMAAGAIPYYSDLRTIDMLGLSDPWVAQHGVVYGRRPGHRRGATLPHLVESRANLVVHPWGRNDPELLVTDYRRDLVVNRYVLLSRPEDLPDDAEMVEIPIAPNRQLRALYLVRDPALDRCIAESGWRELPIHP